MKSYKILQIIMRNFILIAIFSLAIQCKKPIIKETDQNHFDYKYFSFRVESGSKTEIDLINQYLENNYIKILENHGLSTIEKVDFYLFDNITGLQSVMKSKYPNIFVPDFSTGLTLSSTEVYLVKQIAGNYSFYVHELAHCVSQHLNPTISNRPRWLWESIALFEAGQKVEPKNIDAIKLNNINALSELNDFNNTLIYQVGYLLGEFVFKHYGKEKYIEIIVENGNIGKVFALSDEEFLKEWHIFLKQNYIF